MSGHFPRAGRGEERGSGGERKTHEEDGSAQDEQARPDRQVLSQRLVRGEHRHEDRDAEREADGDVPVGHVRSVPALPHRELRRGGPNGPVRLERLECPGVAHGVVELGRRDNGQDDGDYESQFADAEDPAERHRALGLGGRRDKVALDVVGEEGDERAREGDQADEEEDLRGVQSVSVTVEPGAGWSEPTHLLRDERARRRVAVCLDGADDVRRDADEQDSNGADKDCVPSLLEGEAPRHERGQEEEEDGVDDGPAGCGRRGLSLDNVSNEPETRHARCEVRVLQRNAAQEREARGEAGVGRDGGRGGHGGRKRVVNVRKSLKERESISKDVRRVLGTPCASEVRASGDANESANKSARGASQKKPLQAGQSLPPGGAVQLPHCQSDVNAVA